MFNGSNALPFTMNVEPSGSNDFGNGGWGMWIWVILILVIFNGGWGGGYGGGAAEHYTLASDFATLQRQIDTLGSDLKQSNVAIGNGISSLGYDQLAQMNGINTNINAATNSITAGITSLGNQLSSCCCDLRAQALQNASDLNYRLAEQSCQTRQAVADAATTITTNQDANTRSILGAIQDMQTQALQDKIAQLTAENQSLQFAASQAAQNSYLISKLNPTPVPSYPAANLYATGCNCNTCGCA